MRLIAQWYNLFAQSEKGIESFESLRAGAVEVRFGGPAVKVSSLEDIIASKKALGRERDRAVLRLLERTLHEKKKHADEAARSFEKRK